MSKLILFQGDSITDAGRRNESAAGSDPGLGVGYATMAAGQLGLEQPDTYTFLNRGISANRIVDLLARIKRDIINLKPDVVSILIGINSVWHEYEQQNGVDADRFQQIYTMILEQILQALPNVKLMLMEPFVLEGSDTCATEQLPDRWDYFRTETQKRAQIVRELSERFGTVFVPLQTVFDEASKTSQQGNAYWVIDGVHPTVNGHALIAKQWRKGFDALISEGI
ncbi:MAG: SGNH/GDSL hydrolase family protein [Oscillospiraceae bacterium]|nr:SGNH/GDSL hydrolase family protein [Oscillospiraceae bacterium]